MTDARLEQDKATVTAFYDLMFNQCRPEEAMERYAGATYTQHNQAVADGKDAFIDYFRRMAREHLGKRVESGGSSPRGATSSCCFQEWPGDRDWAGIDIFRLDDLGKNIE